MYKRRIAKWSLDKKNKESEMRAIARKFHQPKAQGKPSIAWVRGRKIDYTEIARYWRRKHISIPDIVAQRAASKTPETIMFLTPMPSPMTTPSCLALPELIYSTIRDYINGCFNSEVWIKTNSMNPTTVADALKDR